MSTLEERLRGSILHVWRTVARSEVRYYRTATAQPSQVQDWGPRSGRMSTKTGFTIRENVADVD
jgi:hypothetical protein